MSEHCEQHKEFDSHCWNCFELNRKKPSEPAAPTGSAFQRAIDHDATVNVMIRNGSDLESIIVVLVAEKERCFKRIMELESIAPRKIVMPDGRVMVWHCPDELVPSMNTPNDKLRHGGENQ